MISMDNQSKIKCPNCGSENIVIHKRGYSVLLGILGMIIFFVVYAVYWIITTDYGNQNETTQTLMIALAKNQFIIAALLGLLMGFLGMNGLRGKCLDCGTTIKY